MITDGIGRDWRADRESEPIDVSGHGDGPLRSGVTTVPATSTANRSTAVRSE
ncbi:hypothetical protein KM295_13135 [Natronomonas sp. F2-12]|jgi:hypothetical protein|uniref:Uncharacterized protein n=1 Tax=Natronomonas aquatica TaxID=2841590 RepID=A0A9R1D7A0_9EURY|nr:hypothetical protein [Natronomonas aquatica]MCQ4334402.1 hypothetical protein [Natronomonas aquatica]